MLTLEEIRERLQDRRPGMVADAIGVTPLTVSRIRDGKNKPEHDTHRKLSDYLEGKK